MFPEKPESERPRKRRRAFRIEPLEPRELLTFTLIHHAPSLTPAVLQAIQSSDAAKAAQAQAPPVTATATGTPTAHELTRQTYIGKFVGTYTTGPGRYSDQASQTYTLGSGTSTQAFHSQYQMRVTIPKDPSTPTTGVIYLISPSVATTGSTLILELTADPNSIVRGLPTHYTWTVSSNSGGIYTNAGGYGSGQGTLDIHFIPGGKIHGIVTGAGKTTVVIKGLINVAGVFNDIGGPGNIPKHP